jgi:hypothetical protein
MSKSDGAGMPHRLDEVSLAAAMERYCEEHPRGAAAVRRPKLFVRGRTVIALLGSDLATGISGFGDTAANALRAFDHHYLQTLRPPDV